MHGRGHPRRGSVQAARLGLAVTHSIPPQPLDDNPTVEHLRKHLIDSAPYSEAIFRNLMILLHERNCVTIDALHRQAREMIHLDPAEEGLAEEDPNRQASQRWDDAEKNAVMNLITRYVAAEFTPDEVDEVVTRSRRSERARSLEEVAHIPDVSFERLARKMKEFCRKAEKAGEPDLLPKNMGVRAALIRKLLSEQLDLIGIAKRHLSVRDLLPIVENTIGSRGGLGRVGGKASGMFLAHKIAKDHFAARGKEPPIPLGIPESYYLRSDHFQEFVKRNNLMGYYDIKYRETEEIRELFPLLRGVFKNGEFSPYIIEKMRGMLEKIGQHPLIVRSSSLLEDNFGAAFSGKYQSIFLGNQGDLEDRLNDLLGAIAEVYSSTLSPDPILYRKERNLIDYDEQMAILIQKVVGFRYHDYFLPAWAGVAISRNEWRWSPRIKREDGLMRIALGLGSRVVDRVGDDFPRMVPLGAPGMRPEVTARDIRRYSQRFVDVVDLNKNRFERIPIADLELDRTFPGIEQIVSIEKDGMLKRPVTKRIDAPPSSLVVTFDGLLTGRFPRLMSEILQAVEKAYGTPMDLEFACDGEKLYLLQGRPQGQLASAGKIEIPADIPDNRKVFTASHCIPNGEAKNIEYIVYIDPLDYADVSSYEEKSAVARIVGKLNDHLQKKSFILVGPGRWGSNNIDLGVQVKYADIHKTRALIEVARATEGYTPEVSYGTHFFQDLIEAGIFYLPLYPDDGVNIFNEKFFRESPNKLTDLLPNADRFARAVRLIHVPAASNGLFLHMIMDGESDKALGYLGEQL